MATNTAGTRVLRTVGILVAVILLLPLLHMVVMMPMMWMMGGDMHQMGPVRMSPFWGMGMMVISLAVVVGLLYVAYRLMRRETGHIEDPAVEELRLAFARGDLSEEEYEKRREALENER